MVGRTDELLEVDGWSESGIFEFIFCLRGGPPCTVRVVVDLEHNTGLPKLDRARVKVSSAFVTHAQTYVSTS